MAVLYPSLPPAIPVTGLQRELDVLRLLEIKSGAVELTDGVMFKMYKTGSKDVGRQLKVQHAAMVSRLQQAGLRAVVTNCLVLPDFRIERQHVVGIPPERIVDATGFAQLGSYVMEALGSRGGVGGGIVRFGFG